MNINEMIEAAEFFYGRDRLTVKRLGQTLILKLPDQRVFLGVDRGSESAKEHTDLFHKGDRIHVLGGLTFTKNSFHQLLESDIFWMVVKPGTSCRHMHPSQASAIQEARRLRMCYGGEFWVGEFRRVD